MPLVWLLVIAGGILLVMAQPTLDTAYVNGVATQIVTASIGDGCRLRADAAAAFLALKGACFAETGKDLKPSGPNSAFRTPQQQAALLDSEGSYSAGGLAAAVNKSPHQAGIAIDLLGLTPDASTYDSDLHAWVLDNCHTFGFNNTGDSYVTKQEPWHYEFHPEVYS